MPYTVLLVDDDAFILEAQQRMLRKTASFQLLVASSAAAAIEVMEQHDIDVVVSDEGMPGISGVEFLTQIRQRFPQVMRIILSGNAHSETMLRAVNEGEVFRYLIKPCPTEVLVEAVSHAIDHKQLMEAGRDAVWIMKRQAEIIRNLALRHPEALADAVRLSLSVPQQPQPIATVEALAHEIDAHIEDMDDLCPALTRRITPP